MFYQQFSGFIKIFIPLFLIFAGCQKHYLTVFREKVDHTSLASTFARTPDPRQENPPIGQRLFVQWRLPRWTKKETLRVNLKLVFKDYTEKVLTYPLYHPRGVIIYSLLDEEYEQKRGLLTYMAEIVDEEGKVIKEWKHQLWVKLIIVEEEEESIESAESSNSSVSDQPIQGSVIDTEECVGDPLD